MRMKPSAIWDAMAAALPPMKLAIDAIIATVAGGMDERVERRRPDRHQFVLRFLRRIAILALGLAAVLWAAPRGLLELGVLGPTAHDRIDEAGRAIATARAYGGGAGLAPLKAAEDGIVAARALAEQGHERKARREAVRA